MIFKLIPVIAFDFVRGVFEGGKQEKKRLVMDYPW
jgi:hypothetical protein